MFYNYDLCMNIIYLKNILYISFYSQKLRKLYIGFTIYGVLLDYMNGSEEIIGVFSTVYRNIFLL